VGRRFVFPLAKLTITIICPPSLLKAVGRPHGILQDKPRKKFALRRSPIFAHGLHHKRVYHAFKLSLISRGREYSLELVNFHEISSLVPSTRCTSLILDQRSTNSIRWLVVEISFIFSLEIQKSWCMPLHTEKFF
jgi:hypothetical protein